MAIQIAIDTQALLDKVNGMLHKIDHFKRVDIGAELSAFQIENMHRHRPFTMRSRAKGTATTIVRPHSLYEMVRSEGVALTPVQIRRVRKGLSKHLQHPLQRTIKAMHLRQHRHWSTRPILRVEMLDLLHQRMIRLFGEKINWGK